MTTQKITPERIAVIGGSMSGKSEFVYTKILPRFNYIHLFGEEHIYENYRSRANKYARIKYHKDLTGLNKIKTSKTPQLIIFDDFIDTSFISSDLAKNLFATSRHRNLSVVIVAHAPNIVLPPFIKNSISTFVFCQYIPSEAFDKCLQEFWFPLLAQDINTEKGLLGQKKGVQDLSNKILVNTFKYKYAKLIISPYYRQWRVEIPDKSLLANKTETTSEIGLIK